MLQPQPSAAMLQFPPLFRAWSKALFRPVALVWFGLVAVSLLALVAQVLVRVPLVPGPAGVGAVALGLLPLLTLLHLLTLLPMLCTLPRELRRAPLCALCTRSSGKLGEGPGKPAQSLRTGAQAFVYIHIYR